MSQEELTAFVRALRQKNTATGLRVALEREQTDEAKAVKKAAINLLANYGL
jgi:hypothetical protein